MKMKIAILGWGSLIWDKQPEFDNQHADDWQYDGPCLKLEFSRVSERRNNALTLVLDPDNGKCCRVAYTLSRRENPHTICDLRCREGTILKNVGFWFPTRARKTAVIQSRWRRYNDGPRRKNSTSLSGQTWRAISKRRASSPRRARITACSLLKMLLLIFKLSTPRGKDESRRVRTACPSSSSKPRFVRHCSHGYGFTKMVNQTLYRMNTLETL